MTEQLQTEQSAAPSSTPVDFSWKRFFSEVFVPRKGNEIEEHLSWGFPGRVPSLDSISAEMPRPWLFARCLLFSVISCVILWYALKETENVKLVPAFIAFGCFAVPCSVMILFYETNIFKDVSIVRVIAAFLAGAVMSLCLTVPLTWLAVRIGLPSDAAWVAGPVEEPAKLLIALLLLRFVKRKTVFCGLLVGSAVGAGFAAFESAGYALLAAFDGMFMGFENQMRDLNLFGYTKQSGNVPIIEQVTAIVILRGMLSPFCHVAWTALTTAAICQATGGRPLTWTACKDSRFYVIFALVVGIHIIWNSPVGFRLGWVKYGILGLIAWTAVAAMLKNGLRQAKSMKLALAAGDTSVLDAMGCSTRVKPDTDLWYQRGDDVHGPLKIAQLIDMVESGVLPKNALLSDGIQWHPYTWWIGEDHVAPGDKIREPSEIWAWSLVWWPVVIGGLVWFLKSLWPLTAFPVVLVGIALIDRAANRGGRNRKWPTSVAAILPPVYLALRRRALGEAPLKFILGSVVTVGIVGYVAFSFWLTFFTDKGRVMTLVNEELAAKGIMTECIDARHLRTVSPSVQLLTVRFSTGRESTVTWIRNGNTSKVQIETMP